MKVKQVISITKSSRLLLGTTMRASKVKENQRGHIVESLQVEWRPGSTPFILSVPDMKVLDLFGEIEKNLKPTPDDEPLILFLLKGLSENDIKHCLAMIFMKSRLWAGSSSEAQTWSSDCISATSPYTGCMQLTITSLFTNHNKKASHLFVEQVNKISSQSAKQTC